MGRPPMEFDWERLELLCQRRLTLVDCAEIMACHPSTIEKKIRKDYDCTFSEYREQKMAKTRLMLVERALEASKKNTTMLIFCLKNLCGWMDNPALLLPKEKTEKFIELRYSLNTEKK